MLFVLWGYHLTASLIYVELFKRAHPGIYMIAEKKKKKSFLFDRCVLGQMTCRVWTQQQVVLNRPSARSGHRWDKMMSCSYVSAYSQCPRCVLRCPWRPQTDAVWLLVCGAEGPAMTYSCADGAERSHAQWRACSSTQNGEGDRKGPRQMDRPLLCPQIKCLGFLL